MLFVLGVVAAPVSAQAPQPSEIRLLTVHGVINPLTARYLERELEEAAASGATAVVLRLDTPGGLEPSMRVMVEAILGARVPVVAYVAPSGARAASAGMFLVLSSHIAAMAPGTNIGAAHPVPIGASQQPDTTLAEKAVNDAAALARAIAGRRGRNAEWAELAVRRSVSITAQEALETNVIDLVADDLDALLRRIDGRRVQTAAGAVVVRASGARVVERPMSLPERIVHAITEPNIAYLLLTVGFIGIIAELYNPGIIFPGLTGAIALILAFVAFGSLPVNWAGVVLLVLGIGLFVADLSTEGIGILAVGGVVAFVLGSLMLYTPFTPPSPAMSEVGVSPWIIAGVSAGMAGLLLLVGRALMRSRHEPVAIGAPALVGRVGIAESQLAPRGTVRIDSEVWSAAVEGGAEVIAAGESVEVVGLDGVVLRVRPQRAAKAPPTEEV
ncbi:MAG: NfeD family protein [Gemmatimonadales bacterium]